MKQVGQLRALNAPVGQVIVFRGLAAGTAQGRRQKPIACPTPTCFMTSA